MALTGDQQNFFHDNGYLLVEQAICAVQIAGLRQQFDLWVKESRKQSGPYGETINGKPRFDVEPGHSFDKPGLRRINAPVEVSEAFYTVMADSEVPDSVADLIGPDVKFHHSKINSKLPGSHTEVKWHQDFSFTPHSNDDLVTALLFVDDVTEANGPLKVFPGSHRGDIHSLWHDGVFTGAINDVKAIECEKNAVVCTGNAGDVCLMHTRLLHSSTHNTSSDPRTLFICVYSAVDAIPCAPNPMPSKYEGLVIRGRDTGKVRCEPYEMELPELLQSASFFNQQARSQSD